MHGTHLLACMALTCSHAWHSPARMHGTHLLAKAKDAAVLGERHELHLGGTDLREQYIASEPGWDCMLAGAQADLSVRQAGRALKGAPELCA